MTASAGVGDTARVTGQVVGPTLAEGVIKRRPRIMALAERLQFDRIAVRALRSLRDRYGWGPVLLRIPGRSIAVLLDPADVDRVLSETPTPFAPAAWEKQAALRHFQPHAVLTTPMPERAPRRRYNESVLEPEQPMHSLAQRVRDIVADETTQLIAGATELDWPHYAQAWWRIVRRLVLGDHARDDSELTDQLARLRLRGNWAFLLPRNNRLRAAFRLRLDAHLDRAEPGSLAAVLAEHPETGSVDPAGQVPHWLFAFDAAGMVTFRALALLAVHPRKAATARAELDSDPTGVRPYLRACVLDTVRLWPTTPVLLRESTATTSWHGTQLPSHTLFVTFAPYFHRDDALVPFADRFNPEAWLHDSASTQHAVSGLPGLVPFSAGPGRCPGENLVLLVTSTMLAEFLRAGDYRLLAPAVLQARRHAHDRLPATINNFGIRLARLAHEAHEAHEARGSSS